MEVFITSILFSIFKRYSLKIVSISLTITYNNKYLHTQKIKNSKTE